MGYMFKLTAKSIKDRFGRYLAILLIVLISVAFFSGLKVTRKAMSDTCDGYFAEQCMYDFRLLSSLGFTDEDVEAFSSLAGVGFAEGGSSADVMLYVHEKEAPYKLLSMPESVNMPSLKHGAMPRNKGECLADARFSDEALIGTTVSVVSEADGLTETEFTVVGLVDSPIYLGTERGSTKLGSGRLEGFLYVSPECFSSDVYTEINLTLSESKHAYSDEYDKLVDEKKPQIEALTEERANIRYDAILDEYGIAPEMAEMFGVEKPSTYVLTRQENRGYVSFENDTSIVSGIANIFPFFFVLIALLICVTTMTRMVEEDRSLIGTLKALGYGNGAITMKYLLYGVCAALPGWVIGYFLGTWGLPQVFWFAYSSLYDFAPLSYYFAPPLALGTFLVVIVGILGSIGISCRVALLGKPAVLMRPKPPRSGNRILLERIEPIWRHIPFLGKISIRNMFRYKSRLVLMLLGIGCSCALVVTAFGVRDSMIGIGTSQYTEVQQYRMEVTYSAEDATEAEKVLDGTKEIDEWMPLVALDGEIESDGETSSLCLLAADSLLGYWDLSQNGEPLAMPKSGEVLLCGKLAEVLRVGVGDPVSLAIDGEEIGLRVGGIFDNYVNRYAVVIPQTLSSEGIDIAPNRAFIKTESDTSALATTLSAEKVITGVADIAPMREAIDDALSCLNYIIWIIVLFSGALAFIIIFNLTSINLAERRREIATVEVLGFMPNETNQYILRENLLLSFLAALLGLPLGAMLHYVVMRMIVIELLSFRMLITPLSYFAAMICTIAFALIVNHFMKRQIRRIKMAESLKAVE